VKKAGCLVPQTNHVNKQERKWQERLKEGDVVVGRSRSREYNTRGKGGIGGRPEVLSFWGCGAERLPNGEK